MFLFADEKNQRAKDTIRQKVQEYMNRAEKLKEFLEKGGGKQAVAQGGKYPKHTIVSVVIIMECHILNL
jgi:hypothetical protein